MTAETDNASTETVNAIGSFMLPRFLLDLRTKIALLLLPLPSTVAGLGRTRVFSIVSVTVAKRSAKTVLDIPASGHAAPSL